MAHDPEIKLIITGRMSEPIWTQSVYEDGKCVRRFSLDARAVGVMVDTWQTTCAKIKNGRANMVEKAEFASTVSGTISHVVDMAHRTTQLNE